MYDYADGIQKRKDIVEYEQTKVKAIFKVDIESGKVLVNRLDKINDRFGVMDDEAETD